MPASYDGERALCYAGGMAEESDIKKLERLERYRYIAVLSAAGMLVIALVFDVDWLDWPRAIAWIAAAVICVLEARLLRKVGHSADGAYFQAVMFAVAALISIV